MVELRGALRLRRFLRHWRPIWAAGLCAASFATGQLLFGDDGRASGGGSSLLNQYRQATSQMVEEAAASREPAAVIAPEVSPSKAEIRSQRSEIRVQPPETAPPKSEFEGRLVGPAKSRSAVEPSAAHPRTQVQNPQSQMSHLRSPGVRPTKSISLIEAKPLSGSEFESPARDKIEIHPNTAAPPSAEGAQTATIKPSLEIGKTAAAKPSANSAPIRKPLKEIARAAAATSSKPAEMKVVAKVRPTVRILPPIDQGTKKPDAASQISATVDEENLPPIVPAWAVPRPGTKKRATAAGPGANPQAVSGGQSSMRIELGNSQPRSPATIVLSPGSLPTQAPNALQPTSNPAAAPTTPVEAPPAKDDQKRSDGLWQRTNDGSPFLKPVTYLSEAAAPSVSAPHAGDAPQRLPPVEISQLNGPAPRPQEPRLLPMPLEIANPYAAK